MSSAMPRSSPFLLNHFKRKNEEKDTEGNAKRQKSSLVSPANKPQSSNANDDFKFEIAPPDFQLETSGIAGRAIKKNPNLDLILFNPFLSKSSARTLYKYLLASLPWYKVSTLSMGSEI
jgi:hypothetical protein